MAKKKVTKQPAFHELVVEGQYVNLRSFITGYFLGKGLRSTGAIVLFNKEHHIKRESLSSVIKTWLSGHELLVHLLVRSDHHRPLVRALKRGGETLGFEIRSDRKVARAAFDFRFIAYSKAHAQKLRRIVENLPEGVRLRGYKPLETIDEEAQGVEAYTPVHDYQISAKGRVSGPLPGVLKVHEKARQTELMEEEPIELVFNK